MVIYSRLSGAFHYRSLLFPNYYPKDLKNNNWHEKTKYN